MSCRLLAALSLTVLIFGIGLAALQPMMLMPKANAHLESVHPTPWQQARCFESMVAVLQSEWGRVNRALGRHPPEIEDWHDY